MLPKVGVEEKKKKKKKEKKKKKKKKKKLLTLAVTWPKYDAASRLSEIPRHPAFWRRGRTIYNPMFIACRETGPTLMFNKVKSSTNTIVFIHTSKDIATLRGPYKTLTCGRPASRASLRLFAGRSFSQKDVSEAIQCTPHLHTQTSSIWLATLNMWSLPLYRQILQLIQVADLLSS